jgi:structural maintenance of chromosomes protein 5
LEGFAIDYVDGPEPVLAMLCASSGLHKAGISLQEHSDQQYEAIVQSGAITEWSAGKTSYTIRRRREYGPNAVSTLTKPVRDGRFWKSQMADSSELTEYQRRLAQATEEIAELKKQVNNCKERKNEIEEKRASLQKEIVS